MQLLLANTTDKLQLVTSQAADVDVVSTYMDSSNADPPVVKGSTSGRQLATAITTATTTDIVAAARRIDAARRQEHPRSKHACQPADRCNRSLQRERHSRRTAQGEPSGRGGA
jgi:hypothetical protein